MISVKNFILHLRLHYNFLILSAPFFLGAIYAPSIANGEKFVFAFILIYVFLFGGANAYNSYFDKDEGPIGGLQHPPKMQRWMYYAAWLLQIIGIIFAYLVGLKYSLFFVISFILFWFYSSPHFRLKGKATASFFVIAISTSFNAALMGYLATGADAFNIHLMLGAFGATLAVLSMYPFSQVYQIDEDAKRGDTTFAVRYGVRGVKRNFQLLFLPGVLLIAFSFLPQYILALAIAVLGVSTYFAAWQIVKNVSGRKEEYGKIMRTKYSVGMSFTVAILLFLILSRF